jgi:hypothetical protein
MVGHGARFNIGPKDTDRNTLLTVRKANPCSTSEDRIMALIPVPRADGSHRV